MPESLTYDVVIIATADPQTDVSVSLTPFTVTITDPCSTGFGNPTSQHEIEMNELAACEYTLRSPQAAEVRCDHSYSNIEDWATNCPVNC